MSGLYLSRGLFPHEFLRPTVQFILDTQLPSGEIPWFDGGYTDPWDHVEAAMGLAIGGEHQAARRAYAWLARMQLADGSWWASYRGEEIDNCERRESNFVAYIASGVWHYYLVTGERDFLEELWPTVERYVPGGFDMVADANGVATLKQSYEHLRTPGKLIVYGFHTMMPKAGGKPKWGKLISGYLRTPRFNPLDMTTRSKSVLAFNLSYLFEETWLMAEAMNAISGWLEDGSIQPPPVTTYPLDKVADAHRDLESGTTVGKLVLIP